MKKLLKKLTAAVLVATMIMAMGVTAFAAEPTTCKFTKADGSELKMNMGTGMIDTCDLSDGVATVTFKEYSLLFYKGSISDISGSAVIAWDGETAIIDMSTAGSGGIAGVPVHLTFSFNMLPPGMSNTMDARFVCQ
ncbi:MAG: hypothetical protein PHN80_13150 [Hespellia sp.]|nr:hypothetical protein [Hespellia sp.]